MIAFLILLLIVTVVWLAAEIERTSQHHYEQEMALHKRIKQLEDKSK